MCRYGLWEAGAIRPSETYFLQYQPQSNYTHSKAISNSTIAILNVYAERKSIPNSSQVEMLHRAPSANLHARPCSRLEINICVDLAAYD